MRSREFARRVLWGALFALALAAGLLLSGGKVYAATAVTEDTTELTEGEYELTEDVTVKQMIEMKSGTVTLNLKGHTLSMAEMNNNNKRKGSVIYVSGGKLTINGGGTGDNRGKIAGGFGNNYIHEDDDDDDEDKDKKRGGGLAISAAEVVLNHVEISGNTANYGGGIYMCNDSKLTMEDCLITKNTIQNFDYKYCDGAAIYNDGGSITMHDGAVTLNEAVKSGGWGGVYYAETSKDFTVSGNARVFMNYGLNGKKEKIYNNFLLGPGNYAGTTRVNLIKIDEEIGLGDDAGFGVYMKTPGVFTEKDCVTQPSDMAKFYSDMEDYVVIRNADAALELKKRSDVETDYYSVASDDSEYDREGHGITVTLADGVEGNIYYRAFEDETMSTEAPEFVDAGEHVVFFEIVPSTAGYPWIMDSAIVTITKRDFAKTHITVEDVAYDGEAHTPVYSVKDFEEKYGEDEQELAEVDPSEYTVSYLKVDDQGKKEEVAPEELSQPGKYLMVFTATEKNYTSLKEEGSETPESEEVPFEVKALAPEFMSHDLTLGGSIGVNFFLNIPEADYLDYSDSCMTFTVENDDDDSRIIEFDPDTTPMNRAGTYYKFTCYVNSVQMADMITATFNYKFEGEALEITDEYSVKEYVEQVEAMGKEEYPQKARELVMALAAYGHFAQQYLAPLRGWTIGTDHEDMDAGDTKPYDEDSVLKAHEAVASKGVTIKRSSRIEKVTFSLYLDTDTAIYLYFKPISSYKGSAKATVNGTSVPVYKMSDGRFRVEVKDIGAHNLGKNYKVELKTGNTSTIVNISVLSYVKAILDSSKDENEINLAMAIYYYYLKAKALVG